MIGKRLAHYEIASLLGKGGMGEVYRATDTKLGRDVALKILPQEMSGDPERAARFDREARSLAMLQHPNVASIYGFEESDGVRFLVMELVEGEDLSEHLKSGKPSIEEATRIARQVAAGLEAAHEKGIVHRDLKPANIMVTPRGEIKILDFGLARAWFGDGADRGDIETSPTITAAMTQAGTILGTAAYMSPEQARGRNVDQRADIWAFGVILFEMLSGERLFESDTISDTLAAVLRAEPDWEALPATTPPGLRRLVRRCLQRDRRNRLRDAGDARIELEEILAGDDGSVEAASIKAPKSGPRLLLPALIVLTLALALALVWQQSQKQVADAALVEFDINPPVGHAFREFAVSPDGTALVAVVSSRDGLRNLWLRRFDSAELRMLPGTLAASFPFWAPDSRSIAFFAEGKLRRIDLANENVQSVADAPNGRGGAWSHDDRLVYAPEGETVLYAVAANGGTPEPLTKFELEGVNTHRFPQFTPDGSGYTYSAHSDDMGLVHRVYARWDGSARVALPDGMSESYPTQTHLLYVRETNVVAQPFDPKTGELSGDPVFLASDISTVFPRTGRAAFSVSSEHVLAYLPERRLQSQFSWYDGDGQLVERGRVHDDFVYPRLSHDLARVTFARISGDGGNAAEVWVHEMARGSSRRVRELYTANGSVGWARDDQSLLVPQELQIYRQSLDGGEPEVILDANVAKERESLSAINEPEEASDGSFVTFSAWDSSTDFDLWILRKGESEPERLIASAGLQSQGRISPDDRWIAYTSLETGRAEVFVCGTSAPASGRLVSADGGQEPVWSDDGKTLYFVASDENLMAVSVSGEGDRVEFGIPQVVFRGPPGPGGAIMDDYFNSPELLRVHEGRFLFHTPVEEVPPRVLKVVMNWERKLEG